MLKKLYQESAPPASGSCAQWESDEISIGSVNKCIGSVDNQKGSSKGVLDDQRERRSLHPAFTQLIGLAA